MPEDRLEAERRAARVIQGWLDGGMPDAAAAIAADPAFAADKAIVIDLAFAEFLIREHRGETVDVEEFCRKFPEHHASLHRILAQQSIAGPETDHAAEYRDLTQQTLNTPVTLVPGEEPGSKPVWPTPGSKVGDFSLLRQLGKGAFGRVYLAMEEPTERHVVVKISRQKCDEAKVLGRLGHRNVVSVLSAPHDDHTGFYLVVMPFHGTATLEDLVEVAYPLRQVPARPPRGAGIIAAAAVRNAQPGDPRIDELRPDPFLRRASFVDGVIWLGVRIADALHAVHRCGFVHHDLKPSNVLLGLDGQPRVLDFNLASDAKGMKSRLGGTLPYMPPEHLKNVSNPTAAATLDARADVFSLGVILYELLTGAHPFGRFAKSRSAKTVAGDMLQRQQRGTRPVRELNVAIPHRLARLVERCLAFEPADRPATAAEVAAELRSCYSTTTRARQYLATRPGRVAVTAATVGLVSTVTWLATAEARPVERDHRGMGMAAPAAGRPEQAMPDLLQATQANPNDADAWLALGRSRIAVGEIRTAAGDLERAAKLRPGHGPTLATWAWCLGDEGHLAEAHAALDAAEAAGYAPAALHALRAHLRLNMREDDKAAAAIEAALARDPDNVAALVARGQLVFLRLQASWKPPTTETLVEVDRIARLAGNDGNVLAWAARIHAWAAMTPPPQAKGVWYADRETAKARCRELLKQAVAAGVGESTWNGNSTFHALLGDDFAKDWPRPAREAEFTNHWRTGNPLVVFAR